MVVYGEPDEGTPASAITITCRRSRSPLGSDSSNLTGPEADALTGEA